MAGRGGPTPTRPDDVAAWLDAIHSQIAVVQTMLARGDVAGAVQLLAYLQPYVTRTAALARAIPPPPAARGWW